jgi:hypothetical protein
MLNTFIKNRGSTKTIIHNNHKNRNNNAVSEINWDADYDGEVANVSVDLNSNGKTGHYDVKLNNKDLAKILNISSVNKPIDKRLKNDFKNTHFNPNMNVIYLDDFIDDSPSLNGLAARYNPTVSLGDDDSEDPISIVQQNPQNTHISSPLTDEELLVPLTVKTPSKHGRRQHYKTQRVYKHHINSNAKGLKKEIGKTRSKSKGKTRRKHNNHEGNLSSLFNI